MVLALSLACDTKGKSDSQRFETDFINKILNVYPIILFVLFSYEKPYLFIGPFGVLTAS